MMGTRWFALCSLVWGNVPDSPRKRAAVTPLDGCKKLRWLVRESKRRAHPGLPGAGGFRKRSEGFVHGGEGESCVGKRPAKVYGGDAAADAWIPASLPTKLGQGKLTDADGQIVAAWRSSVIVDRWSWWQMQVVRHCCGFCDGVLWIDKCGWIRVRCRSWGRTRTRSRRWWWWWRSGSRSAAIVSFYAVKARVLPTLTYG
jgi:hypothetical protein